MIYGVEDRAKYIEHERKKSKFGPKRWKMCIVMKMMLLLTCVGLKVSNRSETSAYFRQFIMFILNC